MYTGIIYPGGLTPTGITTGGRNSLLSVGDMVGKKVGKKVGVSSVSSILSSSGAVSSILSSSGAVSSSSSNRVGMPVGLSVGAKAGETVLRISSGVTVELVTSIKAQQMHK
jgi:hypothetical protein